MFKLEVVTFHCCINFLVSTFYDSFEVVIIFFLVVLSLSLSIIYLLIIISC